MYVTVKMLDPSTSEVYVKTFYDVIDVYLGDKEVWFKVVRVVVGKQATTYVATSRIVEIEVNE